MEVRMWVFAGLMSRCEFVHCLVNSKSFLSVGSMVSSMILWSAVGGASLFWLAALQERILLLGRKEESRGLVC